MPRIKNKLQRQIERYLLIESIEPVVQRILLNLENSQDDKSEFLSLINGLSPFLKSVEETYSQYEDKSKMALRNLEISSRELNEVNSKLESLNQSIEAMLESLGPALLFFDKEGVCSNIFSKSCLDILKVDPGGRYIWDVLNTPQREANNFRTLLSFAFDNNSAMSFSDVFGFAPKSCENETGNSLLIDYRPIKGIDQKIKAVLVIVTDNTKQREIEKILANKEKHAEKLMRLFQRRAQYFQILEEIDSYFTDLTLKLSDKKYSMKDLRADVHTIKGLASSFYMDEISNIFQRIEDSLNYEDSDRHKLLEKFPLWQHDLSHVVIKEKSFAAELFGEDLTLSSSSFSLKDEELRQLKGLLLQYKDAVPSSLRVFLEDNLLKTSIFSALENLNFYLKESASRLNKKVAPVVIGGDNVRVTMPLYEEFFKSLIHMARNIMDHGIENPEMRIKLGKPEEGHVTLAVKSFERDHNPWIKIIVSDDGRGLDPQFILQKISTSLGDKNLNDREILQKIFDSGFSSRNTVTNISGRGIGLSAVKNEVELMNGSIRVDSAIGYGAAFTIELPVL